MNKIIVVGFILLFVVVSFQPVISIEIINNNQIKIIKENNSTVNDEFNCNCKNYSKQRGFPAVCTLLYIILMYIPGTIPFPFNVVVAYFINIVAITLNCSWYPIF